MLYTSPMMTIQAELAGWLPAWLPWWAAAILAVLAAIYLLAFLIMPFRVFGLARRLDIIDARVDALHEELRHLALRLPEPAGPDRRSGPYLGHDGYGGMAPPPDTLVGRPSGIGAGRAGGRRGEELRGSRAEPHVDWTPPRRPAEQDP